jgi:hypothetical protein
LKFASYVNLTLTALKGKGGKMPNKTKKKTIYRRSDNGQITTKQYAEKNPKTTEKERVTVKSK